jgi:putative Ca2+/H+ antiporter (TMEM165/GDT1 family)
MGQAVVWYLGVFATIFLAELPDKTSIVVMTLAHRGRWRVWAGATAALVVQAALAVAIGTALHRIAGPWLRFVEAAMMGVFAVYLWREEDDDDTTRPRLGSVAATAFILVFLAEFGDLTQVAIAAWSARLGQPVAVLAVSVVALASAALVSATAGDMLARRFTAGRLRRIGAVAAGLAGVVLAIG